ncbi:hypothetical protein AWC32_15545 [Mycobacterium xenopi]|uniref:Uncharacterized protein n=1 Tax=Mycobacterium xenopi TaxID=1789 RepID=A0AAD1GZM4_MYCXE|nr:hypothetical protein AWC32_15545 [Mycobacterium xenopi]BBU20774.1 hypothetical protein MYXE_05630 [Mycobacterium xenopi]SPX79320.1 Uncharacterised protein [Mycobacterium xenopi]
MGLSRSCHPPVFALRVDDRAPPLAVDLRNCCGALFDSRLFASGLSAIGRTTSQRLGPSTVLKTAV